MPVSILITYNQLTVVLVSNNNQIPIDPVGNAFREKCRLLKPASVSYNVYFTKRFFVRFKKPIQDKILYQLYRPRQKNRQHFNRYNN